MVEEYRRAILQLLAAASQPTDVERIRVGCKIGNWQTALKHLLELLHEGKIQGTKTSKSWVFWANSSRAFTKVVPRTRILPKPPVKNAFGIKSSSSATKRRCEDDN